MRSEPPFEHAETPSKAQAERQSALQLIRWLADLFDDRIRLPGTDRRFGLDGIIVLIPGVGDTATGAVSLYLAAEAWRLGMPTTTILRMLLNVGIDTVLGAIPLLGDLFDFAWKANQKNVRLVLTQLEKLHARHALEEERARLSSRS
jgi:hypothetical protein